MKSHSGKENTIDEEIKTAVPKNSIKPKAKAREFGRELTNTNSTSTKAKKARGEQRAAKLPKTSAKIAKLSSHFTSLTLANPPPTLSGVQLDQLQGDELKSAIQEEMVLRRKKQREEIPDYDMFRVRDSQEVAEYADSIFKWMRESQEEFAMENHYVDSPIGEKRVTHQGRAALIDFVEELHAVFDLIPETLFITIATIDRYLGLKKDLLAGIDDLQQLAVAAILTVSKYEDIIPPSLDELIKQMKR